MLSVLLLVRLLTGLLRLTQEALPLGATCSPATPVQTGCPGTQHGGAPLPLLGSHLVLVQKMPHPDTLSIRVLGRPKQSTRSEAQGRLWPVWEAGPSEVQVWSGLGLPSLPPVDAVLSLCPHRVVPLCVSVSSSPLFIGMPVLWDQGPPYNLIYLNPLFKDPSSNTAPF